MERGRRVRPGIPIRGPGFTAFYLLETRLRKPVGHHHGQVVQGGPHRLADLLQPVEHADGGQDMRRVGALPAPFADQAEFPASFQEGVEELLFGLAVDQAGAELAEYGVIEAGIGQFQTQGVLPVDATTDGIGGLAVGEALDVLEDGGQGEPNGGGGRLAAGGEQLGELVVAEERAEFLGDAEAMSALVGKAAWATRRVSSGIAECGCGWSDMEGSGAKGKVLSPAPSAQNLPTSTREKGRWNSPPVSLLGLPH